MALQRLGCIWFCCGLWRGLRRTGIGLRMSPSFLRGGIGLCFAISVIAARAYAHVDAPIVAVATVEPARLSYTAAPGCFDEETFHHAVASFMDKGRDPFDASSPVVLRVRFQKVRGGYRGSVQKVPESGEPWPKRTGPRRSLPGARDARPHVARRAPGRHERATPPRTDRRARDVAPRCARSGP